MANDDVSTILDLLQQKQFHQAYQQIFNVADLPKRFELLAVFLQFLINERLFDQAYEYLVEFQEQSEIDSDCRLLLLAWEINVGIGQISRSEELTAVILAKLVEKKNFPKGLQLIGKIESLFGMQDEIKQYEIMFKMLQRDEKYLHENYQLIVGNAFLENATFKFLYEHREQLFFSSKFFRQMLIDFLMRKLCTLHPEFSLDLQKVFLHYLYDAFVFLPNEAWVLNGMVKYAAWYRIREMFSVVKEYCRYYRDRINFSSNAGKELFVHLQIEDYPDWDQRYPEEIIVNVGSQFLPRNSEQLGNFSMILRNINFLKKAGEADQAGLLLKRLKFEGLLDEIELEGTETLMGRSLIDQNNQSKTEIFQGLLKQFARYRSDISPKQVNDNSTLENILKSNINNINDNDLSNYYSDIFVMCMELESYGAANYLLNRIKQVVINYDFVKINYLHCRVLQSQEKYFEAIELADQLLTMELTVRDRISFLYLVYQIHHKRKSFDLAEQYLKNIKKLDPNFRLMAIEEIP